MPPNDLKNPGQARVDAIFQAVKKAQRCPADETAMATCTPQSQIEPMETQTTTTLASTVAETETPLPG